MKSFLELIQSFELLTLLCLEHKPVDLQDEVKSKLKIKIFRRAVNSISLDEDTKYFSKEEQEKMLKENPKLGESIEQATFEVKIEMLNDLIVKIRERLSVDTKLVKEDKKYYNYLIERVDGLLKKSMEDKISEDEQLDLKLFCDKFNEYIL